MRLGRPSRHDRPKLKERGPNRHRYALTMPDAPRHNRGDRGVDRHIDAELLCLYPVCSGIVRFSGTNGGTNGEGPPPQTFGRCDRCDRLHYSLGGGSYATAREDQQPI